MKENDKKKFKTSGHYIDQKLASDYGKQPDLFTNLEEATIRDKVVESGAEMETIVRGIALLPREDKLLNTLIKILNNKSHDSTLKGNEEPFPMMKYGRNNTECPQIRFKISELHKLYEAVDTCHEMGGRQISDIQSTLIRLSLKNFLMIYKKKEWVKNSKGKMEEKITRIEMFEPLIKVMKYYKDLTKEEDSEIDKGNQEINLQKGEVIIAMNPILTDQINTKFIEFPEDIDRQTEIASGGKLKVTQAIINLRDYLIRAISHNKQKGIKTTEIDIEKLAYILKLDKYIKEKRRQLTNLKIQEAVKACKNLGLIEKHQITKGKWVDKKITFTLNLNY